MRCHALSCPLPPALVARGAHAPCSRPPLPLPPPPQARRSARADLGRAPAAAAAAADVQCGAAAALAMTVWEARADCCGGGGGAFALPPALRAVRAPTAARVRVRVSAPTCCAPRRGGVARTLALSAAAAGAAALCAAAQAAPSAAYGLVDGRLDKCRGDMPCVSTASVANPSKFGAPWTYRPQTDDARLAWRALKTAVESNRDGGRIVESVDGPQLFYLRAQFPSSFRGVDDVEFRLIPDEALVTYRSASREAIFLYPLQTPINTDKNRNRLLDIRMALGWDEFAGFNVFGIDQPSS